MSLLASATLASPQQSFYALASDGASNWYKYSSLSGQVILVDASGAQVLKSVSGQLFYNSTLIGSASNWYQYPSQTGEVLLKDASGVQVLQAIGGDLYFNAELLAKAGDISNVADWSLYPALSNVDMNNLSLFNTSSLTVQHGIIGSTLQILGPATLADVTASGTLGATGVITASGGINCAGTLDMIDGSINRVNSIGISANGVPPYGTLTSPNGVLLTWNGQTITTGGGSVTSNWSLYPAISNVNMGTYSISNVNSITTSGSIFVAPALSTQGVVTNSIISPANYNLAVVGNSNLSTVALTGSATLGAATSVKIAAGTSISNSGTSYTVVADQGINPVAVPTINLTSQNGAGGSIVLNSQPGLYGVGTGGGVEISAYGASNPALGIGGLVTLNAYSGPAGDYGGLTSAIRLNAANVAIGAGAIPPLPGLAGFATIYGQGGVSLVASALPPTPQIPLTTYIYGDVGVRLQSPAGVQMLSDMYAGTIYPIANGSNPLIIRGRSAPTAGVQLMDVESINMVSPNGQITAVSSINSIGFNTPFDISGVSTINGLAYPYIPAAAPTISTFQTASISSLAASTINGFVFPQPAQDILSTFSTFAVSSLAVTAINGSAYPPIVPVVSTFDTASISSLSVSSIDTVGGAITVGNLGGAYLLAQYNPANPAADTIGLYSDVSGSIFLGANSNPSLPYISLNDNVNNPNGITISQPLGVGSGGGPIVIESGAAVSMSATGGNLALQASAKVFTNSEFDALGATFKAVNTLFTVSSITANVSTSALNVNAATINLTGPVTAGDITMAALSTTVVKSSGDVVALSASAAPVSLSTLGGLVNGTQQYNYWVAVNGSDVTGTGSVLRPFASVTAALAATVSISDTVPINICLTAGTYTENPTLTRNNTFLQGSVGVNDAIIIGTVTFNTASASTVSQGMTGISVVGNVVCSETTSADVSWYILNCTVTSYTVSAIVCTSTGTGNNNLTLQNTVVTQNVTANATVSMTSARLNVVQSQINNTTAATAILIAGSGSLSLFGATLTCVGGAAAAAIVTFLNTVTSGSPNSFTLCTFTYSNVAGGASKTAVYFNNSGSLAGLTAFNQNVFNIPGASLLLQKANTGSVAVSWGTNTTNVTAVPATSATFTYAYVPSTPLRANSLFDSNAAAGTANQVLTAGTAGGGLSWATLNVSSLGALAATPVATAYQSQLVLFNTATNALSYDANAYSAVVQAAPATVALATTMRGRTYIATSAAGGATLTVTTATLTANDVGFFVRVKNGNPNSGGDITISGATGNTVIHNGTALQNGGENLLYWNGTALIAY